MEERTEEEKVTQSGIQVTLGGKIYTIAPLVIKYSKEWRKEALPLIAHLMKYSRLSSDPESDKSGEMEAAVVELFTTRTDEMVESFFGFARELPREKIEETATDGEIILAFMEVFNAFVAPLSREVNSRIKQKSSQ